MKIGTLNINRIINENILYINLKRIKKHQKNCKTQKI